MDSISLGAIMDNKHLTSQSGHAIINGQFQANGSRRALIYKDSNQDLHCELWEEGNLVEVRSLKGHNIHYAEDTASNWVSRIII